MLVNRPLVNSGSPTTTFLRYVIIVPMRNSDGEVNDWSRSNEPGFSLSFSVAELEVWQCGDLGAETPALGGGIACGGLESVGDSSISMTSFPAGVLTRLRSGSLAGDSI